MYSEFTVKLINEVKKREILYNNKYDKRPKHEKEKCWYDIADMLGCSADKCKKHWKNIRDRFVKIKHARDKHFSNNGSELTAPGYIYYDMLSFMTEFSVKKVITNRDSLAVESYEVTPTPLLLCEDEKIIDMTSELMEEVKKYSILYDPSAEFRRFRGQNEWKKISEALYSKFPPAQLRHYWTILMKQYKLFSENSDQLSDAVKNENIFKMMSFVSISQDYDEKEETPVEFITFDHSCKVEKEHSVINVLEPDEYDESYDNSTSGHNNQNFDDSDSDDETNKFLISHEIFGPEPKKMKYSTKSIPSRDVKMKAPKYDENKLDEFDFFGKKVAMQLRNLATKNQKLSRKAEIEVLQLLMKFEENAESNDV